MKKNITFLGFLAAMGLLVIACKNPQDNPQVEKLRLYEDIAKLKQQISEELKGYKDVHAPNAPDSPDFEFNIKPSIQAVDLQHLDPWIVQAQNQATATNLKPEQNKLAAENVKILKRIKAQKMQIAQKEQELKKLSKSTG